MICKKKFENSGEIPKLANFGFFQSTKKAIFRENFENCEICVRIQSFVLFYVGCIVKEMNRKTEVRIFRNKIFHTLKC